MFKRGKTTAIYLHDGTRWRVAVASYRRGCWSVVGTEVAVGSVLRLPEELMAFAETHHARRMAVLLGAEIHSVTFKAPLDADPEELQTALRYETAQSLGADADDLRLAATNADFYGLGADPDTWLLAAFQDDQMRYFERLALDRGLKFLGCGSIELAMLGWFSRRNPGGENRLLFIKEAETFYAAPGLGEVPLVTVALPVGSRLDPDADRDRERLDRASRRLAAHARVPVCAVTCMETAEAPGAERLRQSVQNTSEVALLALSDVLDEFIDVVCADVSRYSGTICPLIGPTPPHRDPYRVGTWLFFAIVIITGAGIFANWRGLVTEEAALEERKKAWDILENARKSAKDKSALLRKQRDAEVQRRNTLLNTPVLPTGLLQTVETVATSMPPYSKLESISNAPTHEGIEIRGHTRWQEGLADFLRVLNDALRPCGMSVRQDAVTVADGGRHELSFVYRIVPTEVKP